MTLREALINLADALERFKAEVKAQIKRDIEWLKRKAGNS